MVFKLEELPLKFDILLPVCQQDVSSTNKSGNLNKPKYVSCPQSDFRGIVKKK